MRLSFVIPTRNQARFLRQCIDSCLAQGVADSEIVVQDGASTDDTRAVLASYGDQVTWVSERDSGQSDAVNKGVRRARGEIIAWINSDDYYTSATALQPLLDAFDRDPTVDIAYGDGLRVDVHGGTLGTFLAPPYTTVAALLGNPLKFVLQPCLLFRRSLFLEVGGIDEDLHYTMDYDLWLKMFPRARATRHLPALIASARYHDGAKSVDALGRQIVEACRVKLRTAQHVEMSVLARARMYAGMGELFAYWLAVRTGIKRAT